MKSKRSLRMALAFVACILFSVPAAAASRSATTTLETEIERIARPVGGEAGVAAWRLDGIGPRVLVRDGEAFPMASTFKVAVAGAVLAQVDAGKLTLGQMVTIDPAKHVPSPVIAERFIHPGVALSVHNLLELMLTQSDNTATDVLTDLVGGPTAATAWVRAQGVEGLRVDRDTAGLIRDFFALPSGPPKQAWEVATKADPGLETKGDHPNPAFDDDPRDTTTPQAMALLLTRIFDGRALSPHSTRALIEIMRRCRTGEARLKGRLPMDTIVAHKTGTIGGTLNDVGVIELPNDVGRIVIAVFIRKSDAPFADRERAIADIGRAVYDFYLYAPAR